MQGSATDSHLRQGTILVYFALVHRYPSSFLSEIDCIPQQEHPNVRLALLHLGIHGIYNRRIFDFEWVDDARQKGSTPNSEGQ